MNISPIKKKIAIVSDAIYPYNKGGKEKRIFEISTRLAKRGHYVHIYTMKWWKGENIKVENGVTLHAISPLYPLYSGNRRSIKEAIFFALHCFKLLYEDFDVIEVDHMPHLILFPLKIVCLIRRKRLIVTWNEVWGRVYWIKYMGILGNISYFIEKLSVLMPDEIISVSYHTTKNLKHILGFTKKITTIPNGIDLELIRNTKPSKNKSDIIFAGRLLSHKNIDVLIKSISLLIKKHPKLKCIIIGDGPEKNKLLKLTDDLKLNHNIVFLNFFKKSKKLYALMKSSKVFVLPSTREGFGIVAIEANACNIPIITSKHKDNAAKDLVKKMEGFVIELNDKELARAIDLQFNQKFTSNFLESEKKYNWNSITNKVNSIYLK